MRISTSKPPRFRVTTYARLAAIGCIGFIFVATQLFAPVSIRSGIESISRPSSAAPGSLPPKPTPSATPVSNIPVQTSTTRISIVLGDTQDLQMATGVESFVMVSPEIASAAVQNPFSLKITALKIGETMLLVKLGARRQTFVIEVVGKTRSEAYRTALADAETRAASTSALTGSSTTTFARGSDSGTSLVRQSVDFRRKLKNGRILRVSGEMFKIFGGASSELAIARVQNFAVNRLSVGVDTDERRIDVLDSQVNISPLTFNGYTIRGFHLVNTPKSNVDANFQKKGVEVYAGLARPSTAFFDTNGGKVVGATVPVFTKDNFQARVGFAAISADKNSRDARGGVIAHADVVYAPTKEMSTDAEASFANGDLSWRARLDLKYSKYGGSAEITRLARSSPLNSIGAQPGGRKSELLSFFWRPVGRLSTSAGYNHTQVSRQANSQSADYDRSLLFANVSMNLDRRSRLNLRYTDQKIETAFRGGTSSFENATRTILAGHSIKFNQRVSNTFEARFHFNKEGRSTVGLESGFSLREQLRISGKETSLTGYLNYTNKTPSLTSLIVRNPQLLPPLLQTAFSLDPAAFLATYRDRLAFLLGGLDLPLTRSLDTGLRFQKTFSRMTVSGESRYNAGEVYGMDQKDLSASASVGFRLDNANSLQLTGSKAFGRGGRSGMTISYTHQFGSRGDNFQFSNFLGLNRIKVRGRVFYDLNGNGQWDPTESGVAGIKIQIDGKRSVTTDRHGNYDLSTDKGRHKIALVSERLGVGLLASTPTEQTISVGRDSPDLNFGVSDHGSISGRVVTDIGRSEGLQAGSGPGLGGVKINVRSPYTGLGAVVLEQVTPANGSYIFPNLRPGKYLVAIDPTTLPPNYVIPAVTTYSLNVEALGRIDHNVTLAAQRAVTGLVYIDRDGDGLYTPGTDEPVEGARVSANEKAAVTDLSGTYILRGLPSGWIEIFLFRPDRSLSTAFCIELSAEPVTKRGVNIELRPDPK